MLKTSRNVFGLSVVVAINRFPTDTEAELKRIEEACRAADIPVARSEVWEKGGAGAEDLAREVVRLSEAPSHLRFLLRGRRVPDGEDRTNRPARLPRGRRGLSAPPP